MTEEVRTTTRTKFVQSINDRIKSIIEDASLSDDELDIAMPLVHETARGVLDIIDGDGSLNPGYHLSPRLVEDACDASWPVGFIDLTGGLSELYDEVNN